MNDVETQILNTCKRLRQKDKRVIIDQQQSTIVVYVQHRSEQVFMFRMNTKTHKIRYKVYDEDSDIYPQDVQHVEHIINTMLMDADSSIHDTGYQKEFHVSMLRLCNIVDKLM